MQRSCSAQVKARALLEEFEGVRASAYRDEAGLWTIGVGHRVDGPGVASSAQIDEWLTQDIERANGALDGLALTVNQRAALISFVFNVGESAFRQSTMRKMLERGMFDAASGQFTRWRFITVNGVRVESKGLLFRREAERDLFECSRV